MKSLCSTLSLCVLLSAPVCAQQTHKTPYEVQYKVTYSMDSLHLSNKTDENLYLYTSSAYGVFTNYDVIAWKKSMAIIRKRYGDSPGSTYYHSSSNNPDFNKEFYKDLQTGKVITVAKLADNSYRFDEPQTQFDWQIKDSTKTLMGYATQKATMHFAGRDYVAWFTMQIPIPNGPYLFSGLPGLIIRLYDTRKDYVFELQNIKKLDKPIGWTLPDDAKSTTKAAFEKMRAKFRKNALHTTDVFYIMSHTPGVSGSTASNEKGELVQSSFKIHGQEISKKKLMRLYRENLKNTNNFIERH